MQIEQYDSLSQIDVAEWDTLVGGNILASYAWLTTVEACTHGHAGFLYLIARDNGRLVAAAPCRIFSKSKSVSLDMSFYGKAYRLARAAGFSAAPAIVVGSQFGMSPPFLLGAALSESQSEQIVKALVDRIVERAESSGAGVIIRNAGPGKFADTLSRARFIATPDIPTTYIDIRWNTFAEFRRALKRIHPATEKAMRNQMNGAKREGIVLDRITDAEMVSSELFEVVNSHHSRLNGVALPFNESFMSDALRRLGGDAELTVARDASRVLGVHFLVRRGGASHALVVGTSTERARATDTYFLLLNHVMARAIESGERRLYFGRLLYDVKLRRGCSIERSMIWIRGRSKLHRAGLGRLVPIRSMKISRLISALEPASQLNAAALHGE